ncbi:MAG: sulfatase [Verrucomicrobiales bacterium]|nr:sulfatase [Verrucomicrobiales bacterium]
MTRFFLTALATLALAASSSAAKKPNIVIIFADDLGYGDLSCFGHPTIKTPNLDRLAANGQKWTSFYAAACVCTPSRAALLTGRYPIRNGMCSNRRRVLFPNSAGGLPSTEITIATGLKKAGYATAAVGKWHLGHLPQFLPTSHGFDSYFGIPYSNDMDKAKKTNHFTLAETEDFAGYNVPLMRDTEIVERPADQRTITRRYTTEATTFIDTNSDRPFFLYLAHNLPHIPLFRSAGFKNTSTAGIYGDVIEEIDWSVGQIHAALEKNAIADNTLLVFTSDNGPWLSFKTHGGSAGLLRDGKGSTWEGGMREPTVFSWPGKIKPGIVHAMGSTLDLFPTAMALAGLPVPAGRTYDGNDLTPVIFGSGPSPRDEMFYYHGERVYAVRKGAYKAHFLTKTSYTGQREPVIHNPPLLFNLDHDPSEKHNIASAHPEVVQQLTTLVGDHTASVTPVENNLELQLKKN